MTHINGLVRWFNNAKGCGLLGHDGGPDVVHYTAIKNDGFMTLREGDDVQFDIIQGEKGPPGRRRPPLRNRS